MSLKQLFDDQLLSADYILKMLLMFESLQLNEEKHILVEGWYDNLKAGIKAVGSTAKDVAHTAKTTLTNKYQDEKYKQQYQKTQDLIAKLKTTLGDVDKNENLREVIMKLPGFKKKLSSLNSWINHIESFLAANKP